MKFAIGALLIFAVIGGSLFLHMKLKNDDKLSAKDYIESRGKTPPPPSLKKLIGKGI